MTDEKTARASYLKQLVEAGHYIPMGPEGLFGRGAVFEDVILSFERLIDRYSAEDGAEKRYFPPVIPRSTLEKAGYLDSMPHLCGCLHSFSGSEKDHRELQGKVRDGEEWGDLLAATDLALAPAACYALYPTLTGTLPEGGVMIDLNAAFVFRREPSDDPARLQAFRMREVVRVGPQDAVVPWREQWLQRSIGILESLELAPSCEEAHDPFFGRSGKMRAASQLEQKLKFELKVAICSEENPTAVTSFNYHRTHFGDAFGIRLNEETPAQSACLGFGAERIALALFKRHGLDPKDWPSKVRETLWP